MAHFLRMLDEPEQELNDAAVSVTERSPSLSSLSIAPPPLSPLDSTSSTTARSPSSSSPSRPSSPAASIPSTTARSPSPSSPSRPPSPAASIPSTTARSPSPSSPSRPPSPAASTRPPATRSPSPSSSRVPHWTEWLESENESDHDRPGPSGLQFRSPVRKKPRQAKVKTAEQLAKKGYFKF
jgi:hypothetical protein